MSDGLNRAQRTAVTTTSGPLLVLAGAGTGKTRVITYRIAELIRDGTKPSRILAVTFTNKAAKEMRERATALLKTGGKKRRKGAKENSPEISTFHSLCVRILRRHAGLLGYSENFTIYDRGDQESVARSALRDIRVGHQKLRPGDLINMISGWKSAGLTPREAEGRAEKDVDALGAMAYAKYQASLKASSAMDFDDLLLLAVEVLENHPAARFAEASRFDHLLIDEYQDTNALQYRIVRALAERHRNLCVVGDDDQSIYGWRGAEVAHILGFDEQWPGSKVVRLEENYRSTAWILHLANTLISHNSTRHDKTLIAARGKGESPRFARYEDESHEAESVVQHIFQRINREDEERVQASDIAILFRTNEQPRAFELELRRAGVPYILVGGQSFYDRKEIKDLIAYLRVLANPSDEVSLLRVINTPSRGIGTSTIQALLDEAVKRGEPMWKLLPEASAHPDVSPGAASSIDKFRRLITEFRARVNQEPLAPLISELISRVDYKAELERVYKEPGDQEARWNAIQELVNAAATYEGRNEEPTLNGFLEESMLSSRDDDKDDDKRKEHAVTLMTLHSAKGLEYPIVYLVGMEEGMLPHKRSVAEGTHAAEIEEERRLAYVGVTRAQNELTLSYCKSRMKWGKLRPQLPSRFLFEMRGETNKANELAELAHAQITKDLALADQMAAEKGQKGAKKKRGSRAAGGQTASPRQKKEPEPKVRAPVRPSPKMPKKSAAAAPVEASVIPPQPKPPEPQTQPAQPAQPPQQPPQPQQSPRPGPPAAPVHEQRPQAFAAPPTATAPAIAPPAATAPARATQPAAATPASAPADASKSPSPAQDEAKSSSEYRQVSLFGD